MKGKERKGDTPGPPRLATGSSKTSDQDGFNVLMAFRGSVDWGRLSAQKRKPRLLCVQKELFFYRHILVILQNSKLNHRSSTILSVESLSHVNSGSGGSGAAGVGSPDFGSTPLSEAKATVRICDYLKVWQSAASVGFGMCWVVFWCRLYQRI